MNEEYPVFRHWYKTLDWILDSCERFPKSVRFSLSSRMANIGLDVTERIIEAIYTKPRRRILTEANLHIEKLRVLFRISYERKYLSMQQYEYISGELNEAGKMIGGWLKQCAE